MKTIITIILVFVIAQVSFPQTINIHTTSGISSFLISQVDSITFGSYPLPPIDSLIAYYPFNGNANDESGNGWHGTLYNVTTGDDRFGVENRSLFFDGIQSYIDVGVLHPPTTGFSVSFWMRPAKFVTSSGYGYENEIMGDAGDFAGFRFFQLQDSSMMFQVQRSGGGGGSSAAFKLTPNDTSVWIHVVGVYRDGKAEIYRNNTLQSIGNLDMMDQGSQSFQIGRDVNVQDSYWQGYIDDIRIYSRALSAPEIERCYHEGGW